MYDPRESRPINLSDRYSVSGEDLGQMNGKLEDIHTELVWLRGRMADSLSSLASGGPDCFVKFVAQTGIALEALCGVLSKWKSYDLSSAAHHLGLSKLDSGKDSCEEVG